MKPNNMKEIVRAWSIKSSAGHENLFTKLIMLGMFDVSFSFCLFRMDSQPLYHNCTKHKTVWVRSFEIARTHKTRRALLQLNNFCMQRTFKTFSPWLHRHTNDVKMFTATWQISRKTNSFQRGYPRQTWVYHTSDCSNWVPNQLTAICVEPKPAAFDFWISVSRVMSELLPCNQQSWGIKRQLGKEKVKWTN